MEDMEARVWQRVGGREPMELPQLARLCREAAADYRNLAALCAGQARQTLLELHREAAAAAQAVSGMAMLRGLELPRDDSGRREEELARKLSSKSALAAVEKARQQLVEGQPVTSVQLYNDAAARVSLLYRRNLEKGQGPDGDTEKSRRMEQVYRSLRAAGLSAEREELFRLTRRGQISDELARKLIRNLDLLESRQRD